jgi:DNA-binding transcriptional regulator GbsR (MarR family)
LEYIEWVSRVVELFESHEIFNYVPKKSANKPYQIKQVK